MRTLTLVALLLSLAGCTANVSPNSRLEVGDISFRLSWEGDADLDLHVREPGGHHLGFVQPFIPCKGTEKENEAFSGPHFMPDKESEEQSTGVLDVDCNSALDALCDEPVENIYWPQGAAPQGEYEVWVQLFRPPGSGEPATFSLEILEGSRVRETITGEITELLHCAPVERYRYQR